MGRRQVMILLCSLFLLSACAGEENQEDLFDRATGIPSDTVLFTVDRREVTAQQYFYGLTAACDAISQTYQKSGLAVDWTETLSGQADSALAQALDTAALYATVENWAETYACQLSQEDFKTMEADWSARVAEYGGEAAYLDALRAQGLDRDSARHLAEDRQLYFQLHNLYCTAGSALHPAPAAVAEFGENRGYRTVEFLFLPAKDASAESAALCRKQAEELLEKLKNGGDAGALAREYGPVKNRDTPPTPQTFLPGTGVFPQAVELAIAALGENEWSGAVETEAGCYLLQRKPLEAAAISDAYFDFQLQTAAAKAEILYENGWTPPSVGEFYANLLDARQALFGGNP